ncbi:hypothetical protein OJAV_G00193090 [Oryzias javanicus]|uniref:C2H2-type domain-containing protein n=1 Tax=Oryzias javanicus TaxID=123683 RepID=A0A3S2M4F4_ORYJA|nr:hypothetical protein OJAV_G00193090 [Oryzias javanicus]
MECHGRRGCGSTEREKKPSGSGLRARYFSKPNLFSRFRSVRGRRPNFCQVHSQRIKTGTVNHQKDEQLPTLMLRTAVQTSAAMEDLTSSEDAAVKNGCMSATEEEKDKVKDLMFKHLREAADGQLFSNGEDSLTEHGAPSKTDRPTLKAHCRIQQGAVFSGKILSFGCSVCKDSCTYSPNDLLKHFRAAHKGTLPTYPCDLCDFVTNEFPALQRHRMEHRNTLVTCELCNDDTQYSLLLITRHYMMSHSTNGQFKCDWCEFRTSDAGTFVQHIHRHNESHWKCSKCRHISLNEEDHQSHMKAHSDKFPFTCQVCGYGATSSEYLRKHRATVHKDTSETKNTWKVAEDTPANFFANSKQIFKKSSDSLETQWIFKPSCVSGSVHSQNSRPVKPDLPVNEALHCSEGSPVKKDHRVRSRSPQSTEQLASMELEDCENTEAGSHTNANGLTVLMVKNKISLPPHCTTKVMGFKVVDGKKHLVLKVIPSAKQDKSNCLVSDGSSLPKPVLDRGKVGEKKEYSDSSSAVSPRTSSCGSGVHQGDIMAIKVKIEEEETSVCSINVCDQANALHSSSTTCAETMSLNDLCHVCNQMHLNEASCNEERNSLSSVSCISNAARQMSSEVSDTSPVSSGKGNSPLTVQRLRKSAENCGAVNLSSPADQTTDTPEKNGQQNVDDLDASKPWSQQTSLFSNGECAGDKPTQNTPNQEVFTFHNYSKETFSASPKSAQDLDCNRSVSDDCESTCEPSQFSLTLAETPEHLTESLDGDIEVDECVASVDEQLTEDHPDSVLQNFNIVKVEEDVVPISVTQSESQSCSTSVGCFVEEHTDAIIRQQLHRERRGPSKTSNDLLKQATTLRILQLPEGKQPVLLRAAENRFAMPVKVNSSTGFKLLTNSTNPQINVSYIKPGMNKSNKPQPDENRTTLVSALQQSTNPAQNHYLINRPGFKGPVLVPSSPNTPPKAKMAKTQPTCYLVQRSVPVQTPGGPVLKMASTTANPRPVLAVPVSPAEKPSGRQAFLVRYISPKSGLCLNNQETKTGSISSQTGENSGNKVIFKIVSPSGSLLTSGPPTSSSQPLFLATRPQTQCFLVSSNKMNASAYSGAKKLIGLQNSAQKDVKKSETASSQIHSQAQRFEAEKLALAPRSIRPPSQRKRCRKTLFDEPATMAHKARRLSNKLQTEKDTPALWTPAAKEVERTLKLSPFSSVQQIKCPRRYQPVVVLNHPDADIPEVANIMKVVNRYRGAVTKVSLCPKTLQALSDLGENSTSSNEESLRPREAQSTVRERFLLKMKLRRKNKKKYEVVKPSSGCRQGTALFDCWFCGRMFTNQEDWIGHGQRHLMEATRDWNKLF